MGEYITILLVVALLTVCVFVSLTWALDPFTACKELGEYYDVDFSINNANCYLRGDGAWLTVDEFVEQFGE